MVHSLCIFVLFAMLMPQVPAYAEGEAGGGVIYYDGTYEGTGKGRNDGIKVKQARKKTMSKVVKKLPKGKYKVKVRAYNKKGDQIVYGKWSKVKKVNIR